MITLKRRPALAVLVVAATVLLISGPAAQAGTGEFDGSGSSTTKTGHRVWVKIKASGNARPKGTTTVTVLVPVTCWWTPAPGPNDNAAAMAAYADDGLNSALFAAYAGNPWAQPTIDSGSSYIGIDTSLFQKEADEAAKGDWKKTWYVGVCRSDADIADYLDAFGKYMDQGTVLSTGESGIQRGLALHAFPTGETPDPTVTPKDLAQIAREIMYIPEPEIDRNPKIKTADDATLVGLDTWLWVTDTDSIGGTTGTRTIRATVGTVWAEVTATTKTLHATSPAGSVACTVKQARTAWTKTAKHGCLLDFTKASVGYPHGYPVTTSVTWTATWVGSDKAGGDLDPLTRTATTNIPVAEVQTVVTN